MKTTHLRSFYYLVTSILLFTSSYAYALPGPLYTAKLDYALKDGSNMYAFDSYNSVMYYSINSGASWLIKETPFVTNTNVTDAEMIAGELFLSVYYSGVYKYSPTMQTFTKISAGLPANPETYCLTKNSNNDLYLSTLYGLYKLANGSNAWTAIPIPNVSTAYLDIYFNGSQMWVATNNAGIYTTTDDGLNWTQLATTPVFSSVKCIYNIGGALYVIANGSGIYRSTDGGSSWANINNGLTYPSIYSLNKIVSDGTNLIVTSSNSSMMYTSADAGDTWVACGSSTISLSSSTSDGTGGLFAYGTNGMYKSLDHGFTWTSSSAGMRSFITKGIAVNGSTIYLSTDSNGIYKSTDNGATWSLCSNGLQGNGGAIFIYGSYVYTVNSFQVYRSADQGASWSLLNLGSYSASGISSINGNLYVNGGDGVFKSTDYGNTWTQISTIATKKICGDNAGNLFAMSFPIGYSSDGLVYLSRDGGLSWQQYKNKISGAYQTGVQSIAVCNNIFYSGGIYGIYKYSLSTTATLTRVSDAVAKELTVNSTALYAVVSLDYGTTYTGLLKTLNNGATWNFIGGPMTDILAITIANNTIYMGTKFWPTVVTGLMSKAVTGVARLGTDPDQSNIATPTVEMYPNPASSVTTIKTIDDISEISIVNSKGELVFTETLTSSLNTYELPLSQLQGGIYLVKIKTTFGQESLKLVKE